MRISDWSSDVCSSDLIDKNKAETDASAEHHRLVIIWQNAMFDMHAHGPRENQFFRVAPDGDQVFRPHGMIDAGNVLFDDRAFLKEIGRASCRERVCQSVWI